MKWETAVRTPLKTNTKTLSFLAPSLSAAAHNDPAWWCSVMEHEQYGGCWTQIGCQWYPFASESRNTCSTALVAAYCLHVPLANALRFSFYNTLKNVF